MSIPGIVTKVCRDYNNHGDGDDRGNHFVIKAATPDDDGPNSVPVTTEYLNEGGANVVFSITPLISHQPWTPFLDNKLLRLRKCGSKGLTTLDQLHALETIFTPLFSCEQIIQHDAIEIDPEYIQLLNTHLISLPRAASRKIDKISEKERYGMIMTDMGRRHDSSEVNILQFKPKWLSQSPNAPARAKRCRTCALRAQRLAANRRTAADDQDACPLALLSGCVERRTFAARQLTDDEQIVDWLVNHASHLLGNLRRWQDAFDARGVLKMDESACAEESVNLCKAMSLRDCTLYLRHVPGDADVEARLGDLDLKHADKIPSWRAGEQRLIDEGWYENLEHESVRVTETVCLLSGPTS